MVKSQVENMFLQVLTVASIHDAIRRELLTYREGVILKTSVAMPGIPSV